MNKFLKNEITKMIYSKKLYIFAVFTAFMVTAICYMMNVELNNIVHNAPEAAKYPEHIKRDILNMNSVIFLKMFSTELVFRPIVPYFAFFMAAFSIEVFGEDFFSGNMKHFARIDKGCINIFKAKVLSLIVCSFLIIDIIIVIAFIISSLIFKVSFYGGGRIIIIYLSAVIPVACFGLIIGIMSMFIKNRKVSLILGIVISIFITTSDRLTASRNFSPIGVISIMERARDNISLNYLLMANVVSVIYLVVAYFIGKRIFKSREFNY